MIWIVKDPDDYNRLVADMVKESGETRVWCFYGDLGSGKTTIIQHLCKYLGVCDPVVSPTFSISICIELSQLELFTILIYTDFKNPKKCLILDFRNMWIRGSIVLLNGPSWRNQ